MLRIASGASWRGILFYALVVVAFAAPVAAQTPSTLRVVHTVDKTTRLLPSCRPRLQRWLGRRDRRLRERGGDRSVGQSARPRYPVRGHGPARGSAPFKARVPVVAGATGYRVGINSFRFAFGRESP